MSIGHFRVSPGLCIKTRLGAQPLIWKWFFILMQIKLLSTRKVEHLTSFWYRGPGELGNGLFGSLHRWLSLFSSKQCKIKQFLESVFWYPGIIKVSVSINSHSRRLSWQLFPRPLLFRMWQKPHPIIVYYYTIYSLTIFSLAKSLS